MLFRDKKQGAGRALRDGLLHPRAIGFGALGLVDDDGSVVLHLEDLLGDRLADAVSGALGKLDFDSHALRSRSSTGGTLTHSA